MISINDHIRYLLMHHDCVVVPGFGAFVMQTDSASFDASTGCFMPPCRQVGFNAEVRHDDGMLAASVARREGVSYDVARKLIDNDIAMLRSRLTGSGMAILPRLGRFDISADGRLVFSPDEVHDTVNWCYAGLRPVAVSAMISEAVDSAVEEHPAILNVPFRHNVARWARVAASVALLVGLGAVLSTPVLVDRDSMQYASVAAPEVVKGAHSITLPTVADSTNQVLYCVVPSADEATAVVDLKAKERARQRMLMMEQIEAYNNGLQKKEVAKNASPSAGHYLIVASCETRAKAERYVSRRAGQGLGIVEGDGRYRIYVASSDDRSVLEAQRDTSIKSRYPDAWIYSRRGN